MNLFIKFQTEGERTEAIENIKNRLPEAIDCMIVPSSPVDLIVQNLPEELFDCLKNQVGQDAQLFDDVHFRSC